MLPCSKIISHRRSVAGGQLESNRKIPSVLYVIHSASGDQTRTFDQNGRLASAKPAADTWFSLGTYSFNKGQEGYVEIQDPLTGKVARDKDLARVYVDAVKFVPKGGAGARAVASLPPPPPRAS